MNTQHTPAPWTVDGYHSDHYASFSVKAGGRGVCAISSNIKRPGTESAANASLIAAAPDLLAALRNAVEIIESTGLDASIQRAAIAKAEILKDK